MKKYTPIPFEINLELDGFVFDVNSLIAVLMGLKDLRDARGLRYVLVTVLVFVILAKLSGEDFLRGIAQMGQETSAETNQGLGVSQVPSPVLYHIWTHPRSCRGCGTIGRNRLHVLCGFAWDEAKRPREH